MIIATAGHIDHGKTALVKALTGTDTDRLAEEKRRGMSIDLGFAYEEAGDGAMLGFVDVPGHERFVRTMAAGVSGVDFALLVVAADDGVMPQTREHMDIIDLLGITRGAVALTKADLADPDRLNAVTAEIGALISGTGLAEAPVFPVSSRTGEGVAALHAHLLAQAQAPGRPHPGSHFRLAIDRVFTLAGAGIVVTGPVWSGRVASGDRLILSPGGTEVRVRSLRAEDREVADAGPGQRAALNIAARGLEKHMIRRGDWLLAPQAHAPTLAFDATLRVVSGERRFLANWTPVHLHIGTDDVPARVAVLDGPSIAPGATGLVRLSIDRAVSAFAGDRFILRDQSATRTIAGGHVIDPFPPRRGRARPERLEALKALDCFCDKEALTHLLDCSPAGVDLLGFALARNLDQDNLLETADACRAVRCGGAAIARSHFAGLKENILAHIEGFHAARRDRLGPGLDAIGNLIGRRMPEELVEEAVNALLRDGALRTTGRFLHLAGFAPELAPKEAKAWERILPVLRAAGRAPPVVHEIARETAIAPSGVASALRAAEGLGQVERVSTNRFALVCTVAELARIAEELAHEGRLNPACYRTRAGIGRNFAVEMLEHFDRIGMTRRQGDGRILLRPLSHRVHGGWC